MPKFASLCLLAYKRPQQLKDCIRSLTENTDYPYQLIVNLDTSDAYLTGYLSELLIGGRISNLIINSGNNRGVGRSFQSCIGVAEGDYIFKIDTDLTFSPGWLSKAVGILETNPDIGTVSLFDYNHYDPNDSRFFPSTNHVELRPDCIIVNDFVSSIYGFRSEDYYRDDFLNKNPIPDDGMHQAFGLMAITKEDLVKNSGFGVNSTYVTMPDKDPANAFKTPTDNKPLIFKSGLG